MLKFVFTDITLVKTKSCEIFQTYATSGSVCRKSNQLESTFPKNVKTFTITYKRLHSER